ncbi:MAG: DUF2116 family Zn-ribbon domain-containing protein [Melioribacteraceae bacterium]|nr:DUF2116 family Zn-ribbon domain-containing protein [Melioribacteraceae bacterium]
MEGNNIIKACWNCGILITEEKFCSDKCCNEYKDRVKKKIEKAKGKNIILKSCLKL